MVKKAKKTAKSVKKEASSQKASKAQKKGSRNWLTWVVVLVVVVALFFLIRGCQKAPGAGTGTQPGQEAVAPSQPTGGEGTQGGEQLPPTVTGEIVTEPQLQQGAGGDSVGFTGENKYSDNTLAVDVTEELVKISNVQCVKNSDGLRMISAKLTNVNKERAYKISTTGVQKGFDTYFMVRGNVVYNPGCGSNELAPGQATMCTTIGQTNPSYANTEGTNRVSVQVPNDDGLSRSDVFLVNC